MNIRSLDWRKIGVLIFAVVVLIASLLFAFYPKDKQKDTKNEKTKNGDLVSDKAGLEKVSGIVDGISLSNGKLIVQIMATKKTLNFDTKTLKVETRSSYEGTSVASGLSSIKKGSKVDVFFDKTDDRAKFVIVTNDN